MVLSGTIVANGYLEIKVTVEAKDSTLNKLNQTLSDIQADKGEYAKMVDKFALYWTPGTSITRHFMIDLFLLVYCVGFLDCRFESVFIV